MIEQNSELFHLRVINNWYSPDSDGGLIWSWKAMAEESHQRRGKRDRNCGQKKKVIKQQLLHKPQSGYFLKSLVVAVCINLWTKGENEIKTSKTFSIHLSNYLIHQRGSVSNPRLEKDDSGRGGSYGCRKPFLDFIKSPHPTRCSHLPPNEISISKLNSDCELCSAALFMSQDISGYCLFSSSPRDDVFFFFAPPLKWVMAWLKSQYVYPERFAPFCATKSDFLRLTPLHGVALWGPTLRGFVWLFLRIAGKLFLLVIKPCEILVCHPIIPQPWTLVVREPSNFISVHNPGWCIIFIGGVDSIGMRPLLRPNSGAYRL